MVRLHSKELNKRLSATPEKEELRLSVSEFKWPLLFMLSLTMIGLQFPLGYLLAPVILFNRYKFDRYDFIIMLTMFFGRYALFADIDIKFAMDYIVMFVTVVCLFIFKKPLLLKKITFAYAIYVLSLVMIASTSEESLNNQLYGIMQYSVFGYFIVPLAAFSGMEFDFRIFMRKLMPFLFIICIYYFLDCAVMNGRIFIPRDPSALFYNVVSTFYAPHAYPFSMSFPRIWPHLLAFGIICIVPIIKYYKLRPWQWGLIVLALAITRTFTFAIGVVVGAVIATGNVKRLLKYSALSIVAITALYFVDSTLPEVNVEINEVTSKSSALRIKSQIDQLIFIGDINDDEDLGKIGTGRMAQAVPKFEHLYKLDREWLGFGFLSRESTKIRKYIIENDMYGNPEESVEVATGVEIVPAQIILTIGYLGLIIHCLFFFYTWWAIRKYKYSMVYLCTIIVFSINGISGFSGLIRPDSLCLTGLAFASVVLANKREIGGFDLPPMKTSEV